MLVCLFVCSFFSRTVLTTTIMRPKGTIFFSFLPFLSVESFFLTVEISSLQRELFLWTYKLTRPTHNHCTWRVTHRTLIVCNIVSRAEKRQLNY